MTFEYTGKKPPENFKEQHKLQIANGSKAVGSTFEKIGDNQTWLATQDVPACNFYTNPVYDKTHIQGVDDPIVLKIEVPPYSSFIEVWCWVVRDFDNADSAQNPWIEAHCPDSSETRRLNVLAGGTSQTGKSGTSVRADEAQWVAFRGINSGDLASEDNSGLAIRVRSDTDTDIGTWKEFEVRISTSPVNTTDAATCIIYTAYARAVSYKEPLPSNT